VKFVLLTKRATPLQGLDIFFTQNAQVQAVLLNIAESGNVVYCEVPLYVTQFHIFHPVA